MFSSRRVLARFVAVGAITLWFGCDHKDKDNVAPTAAPPPGMPAVDTNNLAPAAPMKAEHEPTGALPPGHPAMPGQAQEGLPPGHPNMAMGGGGDIDPQATTPGSLTFDPKSVLSGVLRLDDKVKAKVKEGDTIFLSVRGYDPTGAPGPILAVKKMSAAKWPMQFQLDNRDAMMMGTQVAGKVVVYVRVDKDNDAMTKNPGDVTGQSRALEPPVEKIVLTLDKVL